MKTTQEKSTVRKRFSPEEKADILKRHLVDKTPISDLSAQFKVQPSVVYSWLQHLYGNLSLAMAHGSAKTKPTSVEHELNRKIDALKNRLADKDAVIAELSEEYVALKKNSGGI